AAAVFRRAIFAGSFRQAHRTQSAAFHLPKRVRPAGRFKLALQDFSVGLECFVKKGGHQCSLTEHPTFFGASVTALAEGSSASILTRGSTTFRFASKRSAEGVGERSVEYLEFMSVPSFASGDSFKSQNRDFILSLPKRWRPALRRPSFHFWSFAPLLWRS